MKDLKATLGDFNASFITQKAVLQAPLLQGRNGVPAKEAKIRPGWL